MSTVTVDDFFGYKLVKSAAEKSERRWWFDETEQGRLVLCSEVVEHTDGVRSFIEPPEQDVPERIRDILSRHGYDTIVDTEGHPV